MEIVLNMMEGCDVRITANIESKWEDLPEETRELVESQIFEECEDGLLEGAVYANGTLYGWIDILEE